LSIQGRLDLEPQISAALPGYLTLLTDIADALNIGALTLDGILEDNSGIPGLTTTPTPEAMNRLVYSEWNEFLTEMLERPTTRDGVDVATRHSGNVLLAWERNFRFCGDQLLEGSQTCAGAVTEHHVLRGLHAAALGVHGLRPGRHAHGRLPVRRAVGGAAPALPHGRKQHVPRDQPGRRGLRAR
jgi:hypothetical protein